MNTLNVEHVDRKHATNTATGTNMNRGNTGKNSQLLIGYMALFALFYQPYCGFVFFNCLFISIVHLFLFGVGYNSLYSCVILFNYFF